MVGLTLPALAVVLIGVGVSLFGANQPWQPSEAERPIPWALACFVLLSGLRRRRGEAARGRSLHAHRGGARPLAGGVPQPGRMPRGPARGGRTLALSPSPSRSPNPTGSRWRPRRSSPPPGRTPNLTRNGTTTPNQAGLGCEESLATACEWYERAASQEHPAAQTRLAHYLFGAASASGSGATLLDDGGARDVPRAMALWEEAAGQGDVEAMDQCGHRYIEGAAVAGVPQDLAKVAHWWGRAARAGHAASQYTLGLLYLTGVHAPTVARDEVRGARWLRAAAAQGHPTAAW
eukprot:scaffold103779_cov51-Phaeocystis_antarctica.AAC.2